MAEERVQIKVKAKIDAGRHRTHGEIVEDQEYTIFEDEFAKELFHRPKGWTPPWERDPAPEPSELIENEEGT